MSKEESREEKFKRLFPWINPKYALQPWTDPEEYDVKVLSEDIAQVKASLMEKYITPFNLPWLPGYVLKLLQEASEDTNTITRADKIEKAIQSTKMSYLADISRGRIRIKDDTAPPMPEEVKLKLKELNQERSQTAREDKLAKAARVKEIEVATGVVKRGKVPVFSNPELQKQVKTKYPWVVAFRQDPEKSGGTLVDISCIKCSKIRTIHLADAFHCKMCHECKKRSKGGV